MPETAFAVKKSGKFQAYCRACMLVYKKERYAASPSQREKALARAKHYQENNSGKVQTYQTQYRAENREALRQAAVAYRQEQADVIRAREKVRSRTPERRNAVKLRHQERMATEPEYRARLAAHVKKAKGKHYRKHRVSLLEEAKRRYWADPEAARLKTRRSLAVWRKAHPDVLAAVNARRKAAHRDAVIEGFDDAAHYRFLEVWQQGRCYHCDGLLGSYHRDHLVPVVKQGRHAAGNLALACGGCNGSKHANLLWREWQPPLGYGAALLLDGVPARVISTFAASERGRANARQVLPDLRRQYPDEPLFFDWEWHQRRSAVENVLAAAGGRAARVMARKTQVVEVDPEDAKIFLEAYHLQGFGRGTIYTGLVHANELVAVAAWLEVQGAVELNRMAFKGHVTGGASRLLTAFRRDFLPMGMPILSFADQRHGEGKVYPLLGFTPAGETAAPVYYYVGPGGMFHRRMFMKTLLAKRLTVFDEALSEHQNARINGYYRVFGLLQKRYILRAA